jgi:hypothetical protein
VGSNPIVLLGFMSLFHIVGGAVLGSTLRTIVTDWPKFNFQRVFALVWASLFGCMPLVFGLDQPAWFLPTQVAVLGTTTAFTALALNWLREMAADKNIATTFLGGVFVVAGIGTGALLVGQGAWLLALLFGGLFTLGGAAAMVSGLRGLWTGKDAK